MARRSWPRARPVKSRHRGMDPGVASLLIRPSYLEPILFWNRVELSAQSDHEGLGAVTEH